MPTADDYAKVTPPDIDSYDGEIWRSDDGLTFQADRENRTWWPKEWWDQKLLFDEQIEKDKALADPASTEETE